MGEVCTVRKREVYLYIGGGGVHFTDEVEVCIKGGLLCIRDDTCVVGRCVVLEGTTGKRERCKCVIVGVEI